jgi:hypothetical protein
MDRIYKIGHGNVVWVEVAHVVAGFLERSNKFSGPVKREKFLDSVSGYELVWKDSDVRRVWQCGKLFTHFDVITSLASVC